MVYVINTSTCSSKWALTNKSYHRSCHVAGGTIGTRLPVPQLGLFSLLNNNLIPTVRSRSRSPFSLTILASQVRFPLPTDQQLFRDLFQAKTPEYGDCDGVANIWILQTFKSFKFSPPGK